MRHLLLTTLLFAAALSGQAQKAPQQTAMPPAEARNPVGNDWKQAIKPLKGGGDIFWKEEFDWAEPTSQMGWLLPDGWKLEDPGDIGYNWHWSNDTLKGVYTNEPPLASTSRDNGFLALNLDGYNRDLGHYSNYLALDNSIVSPPIDCSGHSSVLARIEQNFRYWSEAEMLFEVTNDRGAHWAAYDMKMGTLYSERVGHVAAGGKVDLYLNISDVAAGMPEVQFRITWRNARLYYWMIDDIVFMEGWDNDIQMLYYEADYDNGFDEKEGFFYSVPKQQISGYDMMAVFRNFGNKEQWGTHLNVKVTKNNQVIYNENTVPYEFYPGLTDTFRIPTQFVPEEFGHYQIDFSANMENTDELPGDNHASIPFIITDSLFSRCDDQPEVTFSTWGWYTYQHEGDLMGTWYTLKKDVEISSISCYIQNSDIRATFRYVLMGYDPETQAPYELLGSEFMQMDSTILNEHWVTMPLIKDGEGEFLKAGESYMVAIEFWNNLDFQTAYDSHRYSIGSDRSNFYPSGKCWFYQTEIQAWWSSGNDLFMIRMNVNDHSNLIDAAGTVPVVGDQVLQNYPNPFSEMTNLTYRLTEQSDILLTIRDITGKTVYERKFACQPVGEHTVQIKANDFQPGTYFYTVRGDRVNETRKMVIN